MKKVTDSFEITFSPGDDYEFLCWKILDSASGTELRNGDFLFIDSPSSKSTTCSFNKKPSDGMEFCLSVELAERPSVISKNPTTTNVIRESVITVDFDYEMNPDSIYFTTDEYNKLKNSVTFFEPVRLPDGTERYYKYKIGNEIYYKNIKITNKKTGDNLLSYFDAPAFENNNTTLTIPPKKDNAPESYTSLLVCIEPGFFYTETSSGYDKDIQMRGLTKWSYKVNNQTDKISLDVDKFTFKINDATKSSKTVTLSNLSDLQGDFITNNTFIIDLDILVEENSEGQSGPDSTFWMRVEKVWGKDYAAVTSSTYKDIELNYTNLDTLKASYQGQINLLQTQAKSIIQNNEGVYAISFTFKDKAGNPSTYPSGGEKYYFAVDKTGISEKPVLKNIQIQNEYRQFTFNWSKPSAVDYKQMSYSFKKVGNSAAETSNTTTNTNVTKTFTYDALYEVTLKCIDYAGNVGQTATYYIRSDAIASIPTIISNYSGSYPGGTYCKFGNYLQSQIGSDVSLYSPVKNHNGWYFGSDGYIYIYEENSDTYYKYEPIIWRVIDDSGKKLLVSEKILSAEIPFYDNSYVRSITEDLITTIYYANDYKMSAIRAFLNGLSYIYCYKDKPSDVGTIKDENSTYENNGFLQKAFISNTVRNTILDSSVEYEALIVDNITPRPSTQTYTIQNEKIFLLNDETILGSDSFCAIKSLTDYARATNSAADGSWWLNKAFNISISTSSDDHKADFYVNDSGEEKLKDVNYKKPGIVPALYIQASDLKAASN